MMKEVTSMAIEIKHADDDDLRELLLSDEDSAAVQRAAKHVESCESCRTRLDQMAGSSELDDRVREMLSDYPWDAVPNVSHVAASLRSVVRVPDRTNHVGDELDFLGPPSHPELLGRLGRYEIERVIGQGGMGIVLKAHDSELNRPVAVKVLAKHLAHSGAARARFAREAKAAAAVVHEHVVAIHNVDADRDHPFLVMQFVAGESLQSRVDRDGPLHVKEILRIGIQAASGLSAAHEQGVVHRDVKPANILLENGVERVLLTDFGLARTVDDASLTQTGVIAGTPHYMSPEQANGQPTDHRTDLFSLGAVLYFMATGHPPFRAERAMGVLNRVCHDRQKPLWQVAENLPDELSVLVDRLLEKQPAKRFSSADVVRDQLNKMLAQLQQPKSGFGRTLRRFSMRYPRRLVAAGVLVATVSIAALVIARLPDVTPTPDSTLQSTPPVVIPSESTSASTSSVLPVLDAQESAEFAARMDELRTRLDALNPHEAFSSLPTSELNQTETLQSLHQRLERLQENETNESQFNPSGDQR